jgi:putative intracellular protease/amidase
VKKTSDIKATDYGIFFAAGGHAALFDFPRARQLQDAAEEIYEAGGIVAAVCHGPAILEGVLDRSTGDFLIKGKKVTGFTDLGEVQLNVKDAIVSNGLVTLEPMFKSAGARYEPPEEPLAAHAVTDRRVVTGANPASAEITAEHAIAAFNETYFE